MSSNVSPDSPAPPPVAATPPPNEKPDVDRMAAGAGVSLVGKVGGRGLDFAKQIIIARLLGAEAYGLYALAWNLLRVIGILAPLGLQNGVIHFASQHWRTADGRFKSVLLRSLLLSVGMGVVVAAVLFMLAPWLATTVFDEPQFAPTLRLFTLVLPFMSGLRVVAAATRVSQRMKYSIYAEDIAQTALDLALFITFYLLGWRLLGAVFATVLSFIVAFGLGLYYLRKLFARALAVPSKAGVSYRELVGYSIPTAFSGMFGVLVFRFDRLFLGYFWTATEVGIYQAASQFSVMFPVILTGFNAILTPMVADLFHQHDMRRLEELYRINTKWGIYAMVPIFLVLVLLPRDVIVVAFGPEYAAGALAMAILVVGQFINGATGAVGILLIMTGYQNYWFRISILFMVLGFILNFVLIPPLGMVGAALATAFTVSVLFLVGLVQVRRTLHLWPYDRRYAKGLVATAVTAIVILAVQLLPLSPFVNVVVSALLSLLVFFGLLLVQGLNAEDRAFLQIMWRKVRKT